jgi:outer membrane receptor for ferrienterochelin and colicins
MKTFIYIITACLVATSLYSQTSRVSGHVFEVKDNNKEIITGANVYWLGTTIGVSTDMDGGFSLPWSEENSDLIISFVGYQPDTLKITQPLSNLEILLSDERKLGDVVIATRQLGTHISRINPITTIEITGAELCKAACCSLAESFETNASVDVSYTDATTGARQIQLLGLSGTYVQMLTENMPNSKGLSNSFGLDFVPGPWMESIQVSKGAASVTNGYESLTGQINVQFKKPATSETLFVNGFASSSGRFESNVNSGITVNDQWSSAILAHASTDSRENDHNNDGFLDEPLTKRYTFMNRWEYLPNDQIITQFGIKILQEERTGGQTAFNRNRPAQDQDAFGIFADSRNLEAFFKTGYIFPNTEDKSIAIVTNYTWHEQESIYGRRYYDAIQNYFSGNLIFLSNFGNPDRHKYTTGINYMYDDLSESLYGDLSDLSIPNGSRTEKVAGAYFQYTYNLPERLTVLAGLRGDNHNLYGNFITPRIHIRYNPNEHWVIRGSAGKGYRTPNALAENNTLLATSRHINIAEDITQEEGWNYGLNITNYIHVGSRELTLNLEFYRTEFSNQLIMDLDKNTREAHFYNLEGKSYSNVFQAEAFVELFRGLDVVAAWRINDVKVTTNNMLQNKALQSKYKGMLNLSYATPLRHWQFDYTAQFNGSGRIPDTSMNPIEHQRPDRFSSYQVHIAQITRFFKAWDVYLGVENLGNDTQHNPLIDAESPFGEQFDSSLIWGPLMGRKIYFGFRFSIDRRA